MLSITAELTIVRVPPLTFPLLRGSDTLPDVPGDVRLEAAFSEAADTAAVPVPLVVGLSVPLDLFGVQVSSSSVVHGDVIVLSGGLGHEGRFAGRPLVPPSFTHLRGTIFSVSGAEESTPAVAPLTDRPATNSAYALPTSAFLICRQLDAACSPVEAVAFSRSDRPQVAEAFSRNDPNTAGSNSQENHPTKILG
jgi:hypothetical protein